IDEAMYDTTRIINEKYRDAILCVARIEGHKNQLNLIRALKNTNFKVFLNGLPSPNNQKYYLQCQKEASPNIHFNGRVSEEELYIMFNSAKVHVLPSYFETTGLSSLEAAVMGCNIVITDKGDTVEYFGNLAYYCNPDDPSSIRLAVDAAYKDPFKEELRQLILEKYTWKKAAEKTKEAYNQVLSSRSFT
ncbi:MAG TPA: glycosyltransferase, partial [Nitrosopumilaceae archaeon]|nr:glycosyltransferase [Nitrosopumilaceae archaeon]